MMMIHTQTFDWNTLKGCRENLIWWIKPKNRHLHKCSWTFGKSASLWFAEAPVNNDHHYLQVLTVASRIEKRLHLFFRRCCIGDTDIK